MGRFDKGGKVRAETPRASANRRRLARLASLHERVAGICEEMARLQLEQAAIWQEIADTMCPDWNDLIPDVGTVSSPELLQTVLDVCGPPSKSGKYGSVYFVSADDRRVKIGVARDVQSRVASLQTGCPDPLVVLGTFPGGALLERAIHAALKTEWIRGEWFWLSDRVRQLIKDGEKHFSALEVP